MVSAVIVVPGIMGSELRDGDMVVWPGSPSELLLPYKHMDSLLKPNLTVTGLIRSYLISNQYQDLIDELERCGFTEFGSSSTLLAFSYDWRKDNALAAMQLADAIDEMAVKIGAEAEISLLAHSMGGLICRCYLESGLYVTRAGFSSVKQLIMMGTPNRGSPGALGAVLGLERQLFLNAEQVKLLANDSHFPSVYQLLPPAGEPFAWNGGAHARLRAVDVYEPEMAQRLGLVTANLASAARFQGLLSLDRRPKDVRYFCFVGTHYPTTNALQMAIGGTGKPSVANDECNDGGDGTVPIWSGAPPGVQMQPVGGEHGELYKTASLKATLTVLLDAEYTTRELGAAGSRFEISVREKVVRPRGPVQISLDISQDTMSLNGTLRFRRVMDATGAAYPAAQLFDQFAITYQGPFIDHLALSTLAPEEPGAYEVSYVRSNSTHAVATTELFVQQR
jgi:phospholipase A1